MFMGRIVSSKASHKNLQKHLLISRASRVLPMEQNLVRQASEMPLYKIVEIADIELKKTRILGNGIRSGRKPKQQVDQRETFQVSTTG